MISLLYAVFTINDESSMVQNFQVQDQSETANRQVKSKALISAEAKKLLYQKYF